MTNGLDISLKLPDIDMWNSLFALLRKSLCERRLCRRRFYFPLPLQRAERFVENPEFPAFWSTSKRFWTTRWWHLSLVFQKQNSKRTPRNSLTMAHLTISTKIWQIPSCKAAATAAGRRKGGGNADLFFFSRPSPILRGWPHPGFPAKNTSQAHVLRLLHTFLWGLVPSLSHFSPLVCIHIWQVYFLILWLNVCNEFFQVLEFSAGRVNTSRSFYSFSFL